MPNTSQKIFLNKVKYTSAQRLANKICRGLQASGFEAYWIGGAVRDLILKKESSTDIDIATSAKPPQIKPILKKLSLRFFDVGEKFGTIGTQTKYGNIEITTFRKETGYSDSRHPNKVTFLNSAFEDSARRDFTVGALYYNPKTREVLDFHDGLKDLKNKTLRFILSSEQRIKEDPLRMLRAVRFASTLGFVIAKKDAAAIKKNASLIQKISGERIKQELDKIILSKNNIFGMQLLSNLNILKHVLPELDRLKKVLQSKDFHAEGNAFIHSLLTLGNIKEGDTVLRYAALFHDIGKFGMGKKVIKHGRRHISFIGHGPRGAEIFQEIAKRLRFASVDKSRIEYLIKHHMDLMHLERMNPKNIQKLAKNKEFRDLVRLRIADNLASYLTNIRGKVMREDMSPWLKLFKVADHVEKQQQIKLISGHDVMRVLKIKSSPKVGAILERIKNMQIRGKIKTRKQALAALQKLDNHR